MNKTNLWDYLNKEVRAGKYIRFFFDQNLKRV